MRRRNLIWKRSFFPWLGQPSTLIPPTKTLFKTSGIWRRRLCVLVRTEYIFEEGTLLSLRKSCDFFKRVFLNHKSKMTGSCCVFRFFRGSVDGRHLMRFSVNTLFEIFSVEVCRTWPNSTSDLEDSSHFHWVESPTWFLIPVTFPRRKSRCSLLPINSHNEAPKKRMQWVMNLYCNYLQVWIKTYLNQ